jgi:hypothetical protein
VTSIPHSQRLGWFVCTLSAVLAAAGALAASGGPAQKPDNPCALETTERIVAVGDVHGAYEQFVAILQEAKIINAEHHWIGEKTVLVQTGDMMDRGPDSRKALDLLRQLEAEAPKAGGQVHALIGNHEAMVMNGDFRYVTAAEMESFRVPTSDKTLASYYTTAAANARQAATAANKPFDERTFKQSFITDHQPGWVELMKAYAPDGEFGKWFKTHDAMIRINGIVFMHGGPSLAVAKMGCERVNSDVRRELQRVQPQDRTMMIWRDDGPLWYRGLVDPTGVSRDASDFEEILVKLSAKAVVVGHTPFGSGAIKPKLGDRLFPIDTGMLGGLNYPGGLASALEIVGDTWTAIYEGKREVLKKGS